MASTSGNGRRRSAGRRIAARLGWRALLCHGLRQRPRGLAERGDALYLPPGWQSVFLPYFAVLIFPLALLLVRFFDPSIASSIPSAPWGACLWALALMGAGLLLVLLIKGIERLRFPLGRPFVRVDQGTLTLMAGNHLSPSLIKTPLAALRGVRITLLLPRPWGRDGGPVVLEPALPEVCVISLLLRNGQEKTALRCSRPTGEAVRGFLHRKLPPSVLITVAVQEVRGPLR